MNGSRVVATLAARRWWLYGGGLLALVAARASPTPRTVRLGVTGSVLAVMVATYAAERRHATDGPVHRGLALVGVAGVTGGLVLTVTGRIAGLAFVGGGLLFVHRAFGEAPA
mgnify:CR=1 FL=1